MTNRDIPFVGIISKDGYVESYSLDIAEKNDFHHSFCLSSKGLSYYHHDETLRFVMYGGSTAYTLEGEPALDPFRSGKSQIKQFAAHAIEQGAEPNTPVEVAEHHLGTEFEGKTIGTLSYFANLS